MAQVKNQISLDTPPVFQGTFDAIASIANVSPAQVSPKIAAKVMALSNHYVAKPDARSPWKSPDAIEALLLYFHPLNQSRIYGVSQRALQLGFFQGLTRIFEVGAGSGAASLGIYAAHEEFNSIELTDISDDILDIGLSLTKACLAKASSSQKPQMVTAVTARLAELKTARVNKTDSLQTLAVFSYVLTEGRAIDDFSVFLSHNPDLEALAIFEPATQQDGRRLQGLRALLHSHGYHIWAPCPHADACPLLAESERDWCHDRVSHFKPPWWDELEAHLPIKNPSVTVSYLFARKLKPLGATNVRVIGDPLYEKTKVRQMICRGPHREFISWFPSRLGLKEGEFDLACGDLFKSAPSIFEDQKGAEKGHEFRLNLNSIQSIKLSSS